MLSASEKERERGSALWVPQLERQASCRQHIHTYLGIYTHPRHALTSFPLSTRLPWLAAGTGDSVPRRRIERSKLKIMRHCCWQQTAAASSNQLRIADLAAASHWVPLRNPYLCALGHSGIRADSGFQFICALQCVASFNLIKIYVELRIAAANQINVRSSARPNLALT